MKSALAIAAVCALAAPTAAQDRSMASIWIVEPGPVPAGELTLAGGENVLKQRLLPTGLVELRQTSPQLGAAALPAGTQLVEVQSPGSKIYCVPTVSKQKLIGASFQPCLIDSDAEGDFDGWFNALSQTKGLLTVAGNRPRKPKLIADTAYSVVDPATLRAACFVAIERRNFFNIYSLESFMIAFGCGDATDRITAPVNFKSAEMPKDVTILGAKFSALSETDGRMTITVHSTMPRQPFGVLKTTTYRFY